VRDTTNAATYSAVRNGPPYRAGPAGSLFLPIASAEPSLFKHRHPRTRTAATNVARSSKSTTFRRLPSVEWRSSARGAGRPHMDTCRPGRALLRSVEPSGQRSIRVDREARVDSLLPVLHDRPFARGQRGSAKPLAPFGGPLVPTRVGAAEGMCCRLLVALGKQAPLIHRVKMLAGQAAIGGRSAGAVVGESSEARFLGLPSPELSKPLLLDDLAGPGVALHGQHSLASLRHDVSLGRTVPRRDRRR
jgi:hypothetical protein